MVHVVPEEWRIARALRSLPYGYAREKDIERMVVRLARGTINDEKAEWLARAVHNRKGWAGMPVAFDDIGHFRPVGAKERDIAEARSVLEAFKAVLDDRTLT